jgi:hypothetical protein
LSRVEGWKPKARKASVEIGKCLESALQFYYENGLKASDFEDEWRRLWLKFSEIEMVYTDQEKNWQTIFTLGTEWSRLFPILQPNLPIQHPRFQLQFKKQLWPGDPTYGDLEFMGYVDILSTLDNGTRLVVDVKTAKTALSVAPGMMALDGQLRKYAWVSGIREVGFLNFIKCDPTSFKKGDSVTLLAPILEWSPGTELTIAKYDKDLNAYYLAPEETVRKMEEEIEQIKGKGSTEGKAALFNSYVTEGKVAMCERESFTKVKIQFVRGIIPEQDMKEIGDGIGADMLTLKTSADRGLFPKDGGVRFPNAICSWCEMLPICNRNDAVRDVTLVQIKKSESDDWLKELEMGEGE